MCQQITVTHSQLEKSNVIFLKKENENNYFIMETGWVYTGRYIYIYLLFLYFTAVTVNKVSWNMWWWNAELCLENVNHHLPLDVDQTALPPNIKGTSQMVDMSSQWLWMETVDKTAYFQSCSTTTGPRTLQNELTPQCPRLLVGKMRTKCYLPLRSCFEG